MEQVAPELLLGTETNGLRHSPEKMEALRESIKREGIQKPIIVFEDLATKSRYMVNGHHRLIIALELGLKTVPVEFRYGIRDDGLWAEGGNVTEHHVAVKTALNHLYQRIDAPTASDLARYRVGLKALEQLGGTKDGPKPDVANLTVAQVQTLVESGKVTATEALALEREGRNRTSLIGWLEARS